MKESSRRTAVTLFVFRFFRLLVSVATLSVSARFFGVGFERESWILCLNFVTVLQLALWGPLNETFRAKFIFIRSAEGEDTALRRSGDLVAFSVLWMTIVVLLFEAFSGAAAKMIAPSFSGEQLLLVQQLLRYLLWSAIIAQCTQLLSSLLNTYNSFYIPEISGFIAAMLNLGIIVGLSGRLGIYSFLVANYVSAAVLLVALLWQMRKLQIPLFRQFPRPSWRSVKPFILYALPFLLPYLVGQCNNLTEKSIANLLQHNTVAIVDYARKISDIVQTVLTGVLTTIMVPVISEKFAGGQTAQAEEEAGKYLQLVLLMLAFIVPVLFLSANPIMHILYDKGSIAPRDLETIALLIKAYGASLMCVFLYLIFGLNLLSVNKGKTYAFYGMAAQLLMILINLTTYRIFGVYTFVIALSVSHLLSAAFLWWHLPFGKRDMLQRVLRYGSFIGLVLAGGFAISLVYRPENVFVHICFNVALVCGFGVAFAVLLRLPETALLRKVLFKTEK